MMGGTNHVGMSDAMDWEWATIYARALLKSPRNYNLTIEGRLRMATQVIFK